MIYLIQGLSCPNDSINISTTACKHPLPAFHERKDWSKTWIFQPQISQSHFIWVQYTRQHLTLFCTKSQQCWKPIHQAGAGLCCLVLTLDVVWLGWRGLLLGCKQSSQGNTATMQGHWSSPSAWPAPLCTTAPLTLGPSCKHSTYIFLLNFYWSSKEQPLQEALYLFQNLTISSFAKKSKRGTNLTCILS